MKTYNNQIFDNLEYSSSATLQNLHFEKCEFGRIRLSFRPDLIPEHRTLLKNLSFNKCTIYARGCPQRKVYLKDVTFDNCKTPSDILSFSGTIFKRVTFKGKFGRIGLSSSHNGMMYINANGNVKDITEEEATLLNEYIAKEYKTIDWALDISEAEFKECDLRDSIPAHLIKRNPETQLLLKYDKVVNSNWEQIPAIQNSYAHYFCKRVLKVENDRVIVASVRNKKDFAIEMEAIKILREEGIGELY